MPSNFGDTSTVVGETSYETNGPFGKNLKSDSPEKPSDRRHNALGKGPVTPGSEFVATMDYTIENRPFFVPIGKGGVIVALEELDRQLQQVIYFACFPGIRLSYFVA